MSRSPRSMCGREPNNESKTINEPDEPRELAPLLEAFLLASGKPQSLERLYELFEEGERPEPPVFKKAAGVARQVLRGPRLRTQRSRLRLSLADPREVFAMGRPPVGRAARSVIRGPCWKPWR